MTTSRKASGLSKAAVQALRAALLREETQIPQTIEEVEQVEKAEAGMVREDAEAPSAEPVLREWRKRRRRS